MIKRCLEEGQNSEGITASQSAVVRCMPQTKFFPRLPSAGESHSPPNQFMHGP